MRYSENFQGLFSCQTQELGFFLVLHRPRPMKLSENGIKIFPFAEEFVAPVFDT